MTPNAPTWGEIEAFLQADRWSRVPPGRRGGRADRHIFYEKVLADGRLLQTHISHSRSARPSPGRFGLILRDQLQVSREQFWAAIRSGEPVDRPSPTEEPAPVEHEAWVVAVLAQKLPMTAKQIAALSAEEAVARVEQHWFRPKE